MGGIPVPPVPLDGICSVMFNNTLYTYSAGAFQSLSLSEGAQWKQLPAGEPVTDGVCVGSTPKDPSQAALFVVGGKSSSPDYRGLQKFTYSKGIWESISPSAPVTQDRLWHGSVYINSTDSILVYAGSQDGAQHPSSQTFTIMASAPYQVIAFESIAPPLISPILLPWSETQAVMVGGDGWNTKVMLFNPATAWTDSGTTLASPIPKNITAMQAVLVRGDDGCKNLYTFDMTKSPNEVNRTVLVDGKGAPVTKSPFITARSVENLREKSLVEMQFRRRDLTLDDWPAYNSSLAPKATRKSFAVASDESSLVVIAGGNTDDVLCMFDGRGNDWQNATAKFTNQKALADLSTNSVTTTTATIPSPTLSTAPSGTTSRPAASSTTAAGVAVPVAASSSGLSPTAILGVALGAIVGVAMLMILLLLLLRRRKRRQTYIEQGHARRASGFDSNEKEAMGFGNGTYITSGSGGAALGAEPAISSLPMETAFRGHAPQDSASSFSSMAILMGRMGHSQQQQQHRHQKSSMSTLRRKTSNDSERSSSSLAFNKQFKSTISKPIMSQSTTAPHAGSFLPPLSLNLLPSDRGFNSSFAASNVAPAPAILQPLQQPIPQQPLVLQPLPQQQQQPPPQQQQRPPTRGNNTLDRQPSARRSSGWNRYWSGGSALNALGFGSGSRGSGGGAAAGVAGGRGSGPSNAALPAPGGNMVGFAARRTTVDSDGRASSAYSDSGNSAAGRRITQDSATVPPLHTLPMMQQQQQPQQQQAQQHLPQIMHPNAYNYAYPASAPTALSAPGSSLPPPPPPTTSDGRPRFSRVNSGSPTVSQYASNITLKEGTAGRIERPISQVSSEAGYSSGIPASVMDAWDPVSNAPRREWGADRAPSAVYAGNNASIYPTPMARNHTATGIGAAPGAGGYGGAYGYYPVNAAQAGAVRPSTSGTVSSGHGRPTGISQQPQLARAKLSTDMSWLNLGEARKIDLDFNPARNS